jgi:outer membrane protein with beta-barrel domain
MKLLRSILFIAIVVATFFVSTAEAQFRFGLQAGANFANLQFDPEDGASPAIRLGSLFGVRAEWHVTQYLLVYMAPQYVSKGADITFFGGSDALTEVHELSYLEFPLGAKMWITRGKIHPYVFVGGAFALNLTDEAVATYDPVSGESSSVTLWKDNDILIQAGAGFEFTLSSSSALTLDLKYSRSISSISSDDIKSDVFTNDIVITVGVLFD